MTTVSYLMSVTTSKMDVEVTLAILNTAGMGQAFHSFSNGVAHTALWIIPKGKKSRQEIITQLQAIPAIRNFSIVALSKPVNKNVLAEVRELFAQLGWDASKVTDDALLLFINAKIQGQYTYYIDYEHKGKVPVEIQIKLIEEHPLFSPDWLQATNHREYEEQDRELTIDDIEIRSVIIKSIEEAPPTPPPLDNKQL
jgi:hypothetical protein